MRNTFRQGLISYQKDGRGAPQFLLPSTTNGCIALNVAPTPVIITFAHGSSNYTQAFETSIPAAWALVPGADNYLYWDIDLLTAEVSFGSTPIAPAASRIEPTNLLNDQHWFDLASNKMRVWSADRQRWNERIRVFAGLVQNGNTNQIVSQVAGTQVGIVGEAHTGFIMLDHALRPLRTSAGEFLTTGTHVRIKTTAGTSGVLATPPNAFVPVRAGENIPAMSLVYFSDPDTVSLASSDSFSNKIPIGIIQDELFKTEMGSLTQSGDITYDQWDWSSMIGKPLFCGQHGELLTARPEGAVAYRVGVVKNRNTILFNIEPEIASQIIINGILPGAQGIQGEIGPQGETGIQGEIGPRGYPGPQGDIGPQGVPGSDATVPLATDAVFGKVRLTLASANPGEPTAVGDNDARMSDKRTPLPHTHYLPFDIAFGIPGEFSRSSSINKTCGLYMSSRAVTIPLLFASSIAGHQGVVDLQEPLQTCQFVLKKNGIEIGRVNFNNHTSEGSFSTSEAGEIVVGIRDVLTIISPEVVNSFCSDVGITIVSYAPAPDYIQNF